MTRSQLEEIFWQATMRILGLDPDSQNEADQMRVRKSWPLNAVGNSDWGRDENVVFLRVTPESGEEISRYSDAEYRYSAADDTLTEIVKTHRSFRVVWVCYGPDASEDAAAIRVGVMRDGVRAFLKKQGIGIQTAIREPNYLPEQDDSRDWWERYDLTAFFYTLEKRTYPSEYIAVPPDITIIAQ